MDAKRGNVDAEIMLSYKQQRFVNEYAVDGNATRSYLSAGYADTNAGQNAHNLLKNQEIQIAIEAQKDAMAVAASVTVELIVVELMRVATADRRCGCRHCWGIDFKYQWTEREYGRALDKALQGSGAIPDLEGGLGYTKSRPAHPDCPECKGEGVLASSYDVKPADKMKALEMLGKYKNMIVERKELSGPGGSPLQLQAAASPRELTEAELMTIVSAAAPAMLLEAENL